MPRQSSRRPAPARRAPAPSQTRPASTAAIPAREALPAQHHTAAGQQQRQPGLFAQMASTAAGVAVGSAVGHTIGAGLTGMFGGSSSAPVEQQQSVAQNFQEPVKGCDADARNFTRCLEDNDGNFQICDFYLHQLKACQEAARQY